MYGGESPQMARQQLQENRWNFLALIQGWQSEARRERREQLLRLNDIGLKVALENATDIFFIPEVHFAEEKPMLADDDGWWYQVRSPHALSVTGQKA